MLKNLEKGACKSDFGSKIPSKFKYFSELRTKKTPTIRPLADTVVKFELKKLSLEFTIEFFEVVVQTNFDHRFCFNFTVAYVDSN